MRWDDFRRSDNIEDDRGVDGGFGGGGGFGFPMGGGGIGIGTVVVLSIVGWAFGIDPGILIGGAQLINGGGYQQPYQQTTRRSGTPNDPTGQFVAAVLGNTEDTWSVIFQSMNRQYQPPRLRLFTNAEQGGCGYAQAATGPFYCPTDKRIYLDTSFFRQIETRFHGCTGNACKFSQAYVIAHEVGHHVQNLLGTLPKEEAAQRAAGNKVASNRIQVRIELQADCYAGIWANRSNATRSFIDPGDVDAALQTASAIGDDTLQKQMQGRIVPDAFTHGSADQRKRWFMNGFTQGRLSACDTFAATSL